MSIIEKANLPTNEVTLVGVSCKAKSLVKAFVKNKFDVVAIEPAKNLLHSLKTHADLNLLHLGGNSIWISREQEQNFTFLSEKGFKIHVLDNNLKADYPNDVLLNAAFIGDKVIINPSTICKDINFTDKQIISVKQGYSKCSICIVNENAIITDDVSIHKSAKKFSIDSLLIEKGDIILEGFNYGFIGGCCGMINKDTMLFNGQLSSHRDADKINNFLLNYHVKAVSFGDYPLTDIGGIIPLLQK